MNAYPPHYLTLANSTISPSWFRSFFFLSKILLVSMKLLFGHEGKQDKQKSFL